MSYNHSSLTALPGASESFSALERNEAARIIGTILKHDSKQSSYKIALLRSINDLAIAFPDLRNTGRNIAVPLRSLARLWSAYFWPFYDGDLPILQGHRAQRKSGLTNDIAFRRELTEFRTRFAETVTLHSQPSPADGFWLINDLQIRRKRANFSKKLLDAYDRLLKKIARTIHAQPIRYAGPGEWAVFPKPLPFKRLQSTCTGLPATRPDELCVVVSRELWGGFQEMSLYVEALCIHEWALFTERLYHKSAAGEYSRGRIFQLLTERPVYRQPLNWERQKIDQMLAQGFEFTCPWSEKVIRQGVAYEVDHILPISVYPINELWNLVPSTPASNAAKRARLPSSSRLGQASAHITRTYENYLMTGGTHAALNADVSNRFLLEERGSYSADAIAEAVVHFVDQFGNYRNIARF